MTSIASLVDRYCEAWSTDSAEERAGLLRSVLDPHAVYCDPRCPPLGVEALLLHIAQVQRSRPGAQVLRTSSVDLHHGLARFHWHVRMPDGHTLPEGLDIVELSADGRLFTRITGFFGPLALKDAHG